MKTWYYTAGVLLLYLMVFCFWQLFPGRLTFLIGAAATIGLMSVGMVASARRGYFANRRDLFLHSLVILDVGLEGGAYEAVRVVSTWLFGAHVNVARFHDSHDFYACAAAFGLFVGGYHWWAIRTRHQIGAPQTGDGVPVEQTVAGHAPYAAEQPKCHSFGGRLSCLGLVVEDSRITAWKGESKVQS
jgi:hypothetical protein